MRLQKTNGFSVMELIAAIGIGSIVVAGSVAAMQSHLKLQNDEGIRTSLIQLKQEILQTIKSNSAWEVTKTQNSSVFACVNTQCTQADFDTPRSFALYSAPGAIFIQNIPDLNSGTSGFTKKGAPCNEFPNDPCIVRVQIKWRPMCNVYPCRGEVVQDALDVVFKISDAFPYISSQSLTIYNYFRVTKMVDLANECESAGMIYSPQGFKRSDGVVVAADSNGCVDDVAIVPTPPPCQWAWQETDRTACSTTCGTGTVSIYYNCRNTNSSLCMNMGETDFVATDPDATTNCGTSPPTTEACTDNSGC